MQHRTGRSRTCSRTCSCSRTDFRASCWSEDSDSSEDHALRSYPHPHLKLRYVRMIPTSRIPTGAPGALVSLERDTWSPGPPTANTRLHLVGTGHVGSWWVLVRRRPSMRPPARRSSADSRSMREHHLLRILSLAGTLGALEAASLLVQLRSQHRTLLCPRLCQVWHVSEGDGCAGFEWLCGVLLPLAIATPCRPSGGLELPVFGFRRPSFWFCGGRLCAA